jgi:hypothetical protein
MILRRYGSALQSVVPDFDANALTEISFRRDRSFAIPAEEFGERYEKVGEESLSGEVDGRVQSEAEAELLRQLEARLTQLNAGLQDGEFLLVESEQGVDYPKMRDRKQGIIVEGENRLHFHWRVEPPLRIGIYRRRSG